MQKLCKNDENKKVYSKHAYIFMNIQGLFFIFVHFSTFLQFDNSFMNIKNSGLVQINLHLDTLFLL